MYFAASEIPTKEVPLLPLFVTTVTVSVSFSLLCKGQDLLQTSVFEKESLSLLYETGGSALSLFLFVCKERVRIIPLLFLFSTTRWAKGAVSYTVIRYGAGLGTLLAIALMRYGVRGIILLFAGAMPQYLLYVPAMLATLRLSAKKRLPDKKFFTELILLEIFVLVGCILESSVNIFFLERILKIFR